MGRVWDWLTAVEDPTPPIEVRSSWSVTDPALAEYFGITGIGDAGVLVTEDSSLGLTAVFRAISIISGTIAGLPLKSYRTHPDNTRERVPTFLDNPGGFEYGLTPFEWTEVILVHLLLHGNAYLLHVENGAGALAGLQPIHPGCVTVKIVAGEPVYQVTSGSEIREYGPDRVTHIPALSTDGVRGYSPLYLMRRAFGTGIAADQAAARMFRNGYQIGGLVTTEEDVTEEEARQIKQGLDSKMRGPDHAGDLAFVNRTLKFSPWTMTSEEAQWHESRGYQVEEISRAFGVPPHLLSQTEKQTSWGTGVSEQNRGLARYTLAPWTTRIEQRLSRLLSRPTICEYDYSGLLQSSPREELEMLALQLDKGILTVDEVRRIRNLEPLEQPEPVEAPVE